MNRVLCSLVGFLVVAGSSMAQAAPDISGTWLGKLAVGGVDLRIVFRISKSGTALKAKMDSPDQGAKDIPCSDPVVIGEEVTIAVPLAGGQFKGRLNAATDSMEGNWTQGSRAMPLTLKKVDRVEEAKRPQTPKPPFPYASEEVTFTNEKANITLAGTLTLPEGKGPFPAVVLVSGSGAQDRDETIFNHRPFAVISDMLTRQGVAVLRYDDRGVGKSKGVFITSTTEDFADDAEAAVNFLADRKDIDKRRVGIMGHSEGGLIAPIVAARSKKVGFIVMMAGTGVPGDQVIELQSALVSKASGVSEVEIARNSGPMKRVMEAAKNSPSRKVAEEKIDVILQAAWAEMTPDAKKPFKDYADFKEQQAIPTITSDWFVKFLQIDPRENLRRVRVPVLVLNGTRDLQVDAKQNVPEIEKALKEARNRQVTVRIIPDVNHLFQPTKTGNPAEYSKIETTLDSAFLDAVAEWFDRVVLRKKISNEN